jgi:hypothetical protein
VEESKMMQCIADLQRRPRVARQINANYTHAGSLKLAGEVSKVEHTSRATVLQHNTGERGAM